MRLQVSDLALTTLEEAHRVVFTVTSLASAQPVAGAQVRVEGSEWIGGRATWVELFRGSTDGARPARVERSRRDGGGRRAIGRLVVSRGDDVLVLDPGQAPDGFADNRWSRTYGDWLAWTQEPLDVPRRRPERLAHLFSERPVYRPDEPVHLKAFLRTRAEGRLTPIDEELQLVVEGPGDLVWRYRVTPNELGSVYWKFDEADLPTGTYRARFEPLDDGEPIAGAVAFRKEAYRLPRFEVRLDAPERAPLDREFDVALTATYYAGGRVAARPIEWRVTQFPYEWSPRTRPGFLFSSDARFSRDRRFESTPAIEQAGRDRRGRRRAADAQPGDRADRPAAHLRSRGDGGRRRRQDGHRDPPGGGAAAVPARPQGAALPRARRTARVRRCSSIGPDDKPLAGREVTVRLIHRRWHSYLRASDFTDGVARYVTEVVDEKIAETTVDERSAQPVEVPLDLPAAGVYVVELEAHDRLGRAQTRRGRSLRRRRRAGRLAQAGDRGLPGGARQERATRRARRRGWCSQSPFQSGEALAVVEAPEGNRYAWLPVRGGAGGLRAADRGDLGAAAAGPLPADARAPRRDASRVPATRPTSAARRPSARPSGSRSSRWRTGSQVELDLPETGAAGAGDRSDAPPRRTRRGGRSPARSRSGWSTRRCWPWGGIDSPGTYSSRRRGR